MFVINKSINFSSFFYLQCDLKLTFGDLCFQEAYPMLWVSVSLQGNNSSEKNDSAYHNTTEITLYVNAIYVYTF